MFKALSRRKSASKALDLDSLPLVKPAENTVQFDKYVFICGLHRSGTTLMESVIRSNFDIAAIDAPVPENEGQHLQDVFPNARRYGGPGRFAFAPAMNPTVPCESECARLRQRLLQCWTPWLTGESSNLLEKSPPNLTKIAWLRAVFPGARFVIVTRDPRAVAAATLKWAKTSIPELIFHWQVAHEIALAENGNDCLWVRYEDYCDDPEGTVGRLNRFLPITRSSTVDVADDRFAGVRNSNERYLAGLEPAFYGNGVWRELGYKL